jgi:hypothetical protein
VNWSERPVGATIVALLVLFVGTPIIFMIMWFCSSWRRWYLPNQQEDDEAAAKEIDNANDDEEQCKQPIPIQSDLNSETTPHYDESY